MVLGGNSDAALDRVVAYGDGWYGFNLSIDEIPDRLEALATRCEQMGRARDSIEIAVSLRGGSPADISTLGELGVDELVVVESPPENAEDAEGWVTETARAMGG